MTLDEAATVQEAAECMAAREASSLLVTRQGTVVGLFTEQDLLRRVVGRGLNPGSVTLGEVCTRNLVSIGADTRCLRAIAKKQAHRCRRLVAYRGQRLIGLVTLTNLVHALARQGRGHDLVVNTLGLVTIAVGVGVIAVLLLPLPEMVQFAGGVSRR